MSLSVWKFVKGCSNEMLTSLSTLKMEQLSVSLKEQNYEYIIEITISTVTLTTPNAWIHHVVIF